MGEIYPTSDSDREARTALLFALRNSDSGIDAVARIGRACMELLPVDGVSISLMTGTDRRETLYASDDVVTQIEALQFSLGEGPCFEAFETRRPVLVADLPAAIAPAWPMFAAEMVGRPVGAIFSFPVISGAASLGAMDLYREASGWLSGSDIAIALQTVDIVTLALLRMQLEDSDVPWWTEAASSNRAQVHQASGMLVAAFGIASEQALVRLRSYAFATGRLVDDVADDLVTRRLVPSDLDQQ